MAKSEIYRKEESFVLRQVMRLADGDVTVSQMAKIVGCSKKTLEKLRKELGLRRLNQGGQIGRNVFTGEQVWRSEGERISIEA